MSRKLDCPPGTNRSSACEWTRENHAPKMLTLSRVVASDDHETRVVPCLYREPEFFSRSPVAPFCRTLKLRLPFRVFRVFRGSSPREISNFQSDIAQKRP